MVTCYFFSRFTKAIALLLCVASGSSLPTRAVPLDEIINLRTLNGIAAAGSVGSFAFSALPVLKSINDQAFLEVLGKIPKFRLVFEAMSAFASIYDVKHFNKNTHYPVAVLNGLCMLYAASRVAWCADTLGKTSISDPVKCSLKDVDSLPYGFINGLQAVLSAIRLYKAL